LLLTVIRVALSLKADVVVTATHATQDRLTAVGSCSAFFSGTTALCIFGSCYLQSVRTTHLPSLQDNTSYAGGTLLGFSQWEGEKEGRPFGGARRMNAATQTASQLADDH
jgi:hypothetical protein